MTPATRIWYGSGALPRVARALLTPLSWVYGAAAEVNGWRMARAQQESALPALSIGNLSVGGTGKTPLAAWAAMRLLERGAAPAIVMRGYGDDEMIVHARLNPGIRVVTDADRIGGVRRARDAGADCVILDDAFQHRRISRLADWVLVAAEQWKPGLRVLPAGPLREPLRALHRADAIIVTRKSVGADAGDKVAQALALHADANRIATCHFALGSLRRASGAGEQPLETLRGARVFAIAAVGDPRAFFDQLAAAGAVVREAAFADHHAFDAADAARLARDACAADIVVCTLKDAVKLAPLWPPAAMPLWYVSQHLVIEQGREILDHWIETVLAARRSVSSTAGDAGPSNRLHGHRSSTAD